MQLPHPLPIARLHLTPISSTTWIKGRTPYRYRDLGERKLYAASCSHVLETCRNVYTCTYLDLIQQLNVMQIGPRIRMDGIKNTILHVDYRSVQSSSVVSHINHGCKGRSSTRLIKAKTANYNPQEISRGCIRFSNSIHAKDSQRKSPDL